MDPNAYTPITDDLIVLDLTDCQDWGDLHQRIRKTFGFPAYYGENWDAMWDCLRDIFWKTDQRQIHIKGYHTMGKNLQDYCRDMRDILCLLEERCPEVVVKYL